MHTIQFDAHTEAALTQRAAMAGKDSDQLIKGVLSEYLAEQADNEQADATYSRYLAGQEKALSLDELERGLGLEG